MPPSPSWLNQRNRRFRFGLNWKSFAKSELNHESVSNAEHALRELLGVEDLSGRTFLDIGCGSGIVSLAALRMGAKVTSFDYDIDSVECTRSLRYSFGFKDSDWTILHGSILDISFVQSLGTFDFVYSWGVLHHTGDMRSALVNASIPALKSNAILVVSIYNSQGAISVFWSILKRLYCLGGVFRLLVTVPYLSLAYLYAFILGISKYKHPFGYFRNYRSRRGMSFYHDLIDWLGGYPYEHAQPKAISDLYESLGFELCYSTITSGMGCNEFRFRNSSL